MNRPDRFSAGADRISASGLSGKEKGQLTTPDMACLSIEATGFEPMTSRPPVPRSKAQDRGLSQYMAFIDPTQSQVLQGLACNSVQGNRGLALDQKGSAAVWKRHGTGTAVE